MTMQENDGVPGRSIDDAVREHAATRPDALAVSGPALTLTWRELDEAADRAAGHLARNGVGPGDRVGWLGHNDIGFPVILLGAWRRRAALVGLNWRQPVADLRAAAETIGLKHLVAGPELADTARGIVAPDAVSVIDQTAVPWPDVPAAEPLVPSPGDEGIIYFTSGTTGAPKSVPLTRRAVDATIPYADVHHFSTESRMLIVPPTFHAAGATWTQYGLAAGATMVYSTAAAPPALVRAFAEHEITHAVLVPTLIRAMVDQLRAEPVALPRLEHIGYGASSITQTLLAEALETLGCEFCQVYGMTEAGGGVCFLTSDDHQLNGEHTGRLASAGRPGAGVDLSVRDVATGAEVPQGTPGELWFRAPSMTEGYLNGGDAARPALVGGWLNTHDVGYVDPDGYVFVQGRSDDMIVTGGENVHPAEVENVIARLPEVLECAVYAVPDERWGQRVCASVVLRDPDGLTVDAMTEHCRAHLAGYKVPKLIRIVAGLPRTATGKILRPQLVKEAAEAAETTAAGTGADA
ncbi:class I adenylate-forming enzyme family protein [Actinomadura sp. 9N407]|uniref:class I adenylate-forming enzyme family protein n=1 Tax=Actinomadura sp. 9N407 TaxID=3375154 RepID=UPI003794F517